MCRPETEDPGDYAIWDVFPTPTSPSSTTVYVTPALAIRTLKYLKMPLSQSFHNLQAAGCCYTHGLFTAWTVVSPNLLVPDQAMPRYINFYRASRHPLKVSLHVKEFSLLMTWPAPPPPELVLSDLASLLLRQAPACVQLAISDH